MMFLKKRLPVPPDREFRPIDDSREGSPPLDVTEHMPLFEHNLVRPDEEAKFKKEYSSLVLDTEPKESQLKMGTPLKWMMPLTVDEHLVGFQLKVTCGFFGKDRQFLTQQTFDVESQDGVMKALIGHTAEGVPVFKPLDELNPSFIVPNPTYDPTGGKGVIYEAPRPLSTTSDMYAQIPEDEPHGYTEISRGSSPVYQEPGPGRAPYLEPMRDPSRVYEEIGNPGLSMSNPIYDGRPASPFYGGAGVNKPPSPDSGNGSSSPESEYFGFSRSSSPVDEPVAPGYKRYFIQIGDLFLQVVRPIKIGEQVQSDGTH